MKGDFTRFTFDPQKRYSGVYMQQGRLQLDADWNEQVKIQNYLLQTYAGDIIGASDQQFSGAPIVYKEDGKEDLEKNFNIRAIPNEPNKADFLISAGRIYVHGILCETNQEIHYSEQPDYDNELNKDVDGKPLETNTIYLAYLDVWERHITVLEDSDLFEVALNGLDTATRTKTVWQVKLMEIGENQQDQQKNAEQLKKKWQEFLSKNQVQKDKNKLGSLTVKGTESIPDNRLYRIEIHKESEKEKANFKWSRSNGSIAFSVKNIEGDIITVDSRHLDISQFLASGQWIEIIDESREKNNQHGTLVQLKDVIPTSPEASRIIIDSNTAKGEKFPLTKEGKPLVKTKIRLWNHDPNQTDKPLYSTSGKVTLEDGIEVEFPDDSFQYKTGDYWLLPVRANQKLEGNGQQLLLNRIKHHYLKLASATFNGSTFVKNLQDNQDNTDNWQDERSKFPSLTKPNAINQKEVLKDLKSLSIGTPETLATLEVQSSIQSKNDYTIESKKNDPVVIASGFAPKDTLYVGTIIYAKSTNNPAEEPKPRTITEINPKTEGHPSGDGAAFKVDSPFDPPLPSGTTFTYQLPIARFFTDQNNSQTQVVISSQGNVMANKFIGNGSDLTGITAQQVGALVSIGGVSNPGGDIVLSHSGAITIAPDDNNNLITIGETHSVLQNNPHHVTAQQVGALTTVGGVSNPEGNIDLSHSGAITITPDDNNNRINIGETHSVLQNNPHHVTAQQVGALVSIGGVSNPGGDIVLSHSGAITIAPDDNNNLITIGETHSVLQNNPHGVTAQQVGALTTVGGVSNPEGNIDLSHSGAITIAPDDNNNRITIGETHSVLQNNPHGVTAQQVGAFPITGGDITGDVNLRATLNVTHNVIIGAPPQQVQSGSNLYINGQLFTGSSKQIKDNIVELSSQEVTELLKGLKPVKYSYKTDQEEKVHAGFISEEVPDLVASSDKKAISPVDIVAILTKAVQDQQHTASLLINLIDQQQKEITRLKEQVRLLEDKSQKNNSWFR